MKTTLSQHFLAEFSASEVDPYRDDHPEKDGEPCRSCDTPDGTHAFDTWDIAVATIEEAYSRAFTAARESYKRKHGEDAVGLSAMRVRVDIPDEAIPALISMLVNDLDKWSDWIRSGDMSAGAYVNAGNRLIEKLRRERDEKGIVSPCEYWFN